jgi:hypothetical protein
MHRMMTAALVATVLTIPIDLGACGDKFLRVGRSTRYQRYAAVHPGSILIYSPATASREGIKELETLLTRAGHKAHAVPHGTAVGSTVVTGKFDVVIAAYADTSRLESELAAVPSKPELLPLLVKPTREALMAAERTYRHLLKIDAMTKSEALAEIDEVMAGRQHGAAARAR